MKRVSILGMAAVAALACGGASIARAGLLVNESFETGEVNKWPNYDSDNGAVVGWRATVLRDGAGAPYEFAGYNISNESRVGKDGAQFLSVTRSTIQTSAAVRPDAVAGQTFTLTMLYKLDSWAPIWSSPSLYIDFFSDKEGYTPVGSSAAKALANFAWAPDHSVSEYQAGFIQQTMSATAPEGATSVGVRLVGRPPGDWGYSVDAFDLTGSEVPEPASLGLFVLGPAVALLRRRRR
jgi:hypothetical protein